jgi:hypothetical protein
MIEDKMTEQEIKTEEVVDGQSGLPGMESSSGFSIKEEPNIVDDKFIREDEEKFLDEKFPIEEKEDQPKEQSKQQEVSSELPKGYDKAAKALKLDGWDDEDLKSLSPERIIALGKKAQERHSAIGRKLQDAASKKAEEFDEVEDEDEDSESATAGMVDEGPEDEEPGSAEPSGQPRSANGKFSIDYRSIAKPVSDAIGLGDEVEEALASALEKALAPLREKVAEYETYQAQVIEQRGEEIGQAAREKLSDKFPGLQDEAKFEKVVSRMHQLAKSSDQYKSMEELMLDAAKIELFDDNESTIKRTSVQSKRAQGQPTTVSRKMPSTGMTAEDKEDAVLDAIFSGKGRNEARSIYFGR